MLMYVSRDKGFNLNKVRISQNEPSVRCTNLGSVAEKILYGATSEASVRIDAQIFKAIFDILPEEGDCFLVEYEYNGMDKIDKLPSRD